MKVQKMSLANMKGKLSREEMKKIVAGKMQATKCNCNSADDCKTYNESCMSYACDGGYAGVCGCI